MHSSYGLKAVMRVSNYARTISSQRNFEVNAGELNKRIAIIEKTQTVDGDGYNLYDEREVYSCWAKFTRTSGTEKIKSNADFAQITARFLIRYTKKQLSRKMLVRYAGNDYEIEYLNDYGDSHRYIEIWCNLVTQEG